ncbi:MAG TPA: hypothetical protein VM120_07940 [Bryobacteraceae bacterium]|nr:hypothetical protein [Bryobacteraceae bacterium]
MTETGLLLFPWDLEREGIDPVMRFAADSGIRTLYLASSYHAGRFLHPHGPQPLVYTPEDGVVYFHPRHERYGLMKPRVAAMARDVDWLEALGSRVDRYGLRLAAWAVCLHNTRLGRLHPDAVVRNAFDDPYWYALCPSHPAVQHYLELLIADHARYPLAAIIIEAFRYMDAVHGEHHERWSVPLPNLERALLGLSFAPTDLLEASHSGIDGPRVRQIVREHLTLFFSAYPELPTGMPLSVQEFEDRQPELRAYRECLVKILDSLLARVAAGVKQTDIELIGQGLQEFNITCAPNHPSLDVLILSGLPASGRPPGKKVYEVLRLGFGEIASPGQMRDKVGSAARQNVDGILFYNYGETPATVLRWLGPVLRGV